MLVRAILPQWAEEEFPDRRRAIEGDFDDQRLLELNEQFYSIFYFPNHPRNYEGGSFVDGPDIDVFSWVFVDCDLKDEVYSSKDDFIERLGEFPLTPTKVVDSGNGIHAYWLVSDLDVKSYLKLQRRLCRHFNTDEAVSKIPQLMRLPGYVNPKHKDAMVVCEELLSDDVTYTCEELSKVLPPLTKADADYCQRHYDDTYGLNQSVTEVKETLPLKFSKLLKDSKEVKELYAGNPPDRSRADYRLAHIMLAEGFTKDEALSVLVNCPKAMERSPTHRLGYARGIVDKVGEFETAPKEEQLSNSVRDILRRGIAIEGTRLPCSQIYDGTQNGFRLSQVLGLIGGAGSGKTTLALNYFYHFTKANPEYIHVFVSLEQPEEEIARRWARLAAANDILHDRVHVLGNYNQDGSYRNLSLTEIEEYLVKLQEDNGVKVGCVVIDHIGVLKKKGKDGENQGLIDVCHTMKSFAKRTNTFLVMQSQTNREKAGIGDLELDKDAAYGTSMFEWYCDYVVTTWQPLKRIYDQAPQMTCSAFKYCKIRHKNVRFDKTREDVVHVLMYDTDTEILKQMTQKEEQSYEWFNKQATTLRNRDRKREPTQVTKIDWVTEDSDGTPSNNQG